MADIMHAYYNTLAKHKKDIADTNARLFFQSKIASINLRKQVNLPLLAKFFSLFLLVDYACYQSMKQDVLSIHKLLEQPNMLTVLNFL